MREFQKAGLPSRSLAATDESAFAAVAGYGVTAFALAALRAKTGGDGSRTRVLNAIYTTFYMFSRFLISERGCEPTRFPLQSVHVIDSLGVAVAPSQASLLSSHSGPAGVSRNASWLN